MPTNEAVADAKHLSMSLSSQTHSHALIGTAEDISPRLKALVHRPNDLKHRNRQCPPMQSACLRYNTPPWASEVEIVDSPMQTALNQVEAQAHLGSSGSKWSSLLYVSTSIYTELEGRCSKESRPYSHQDRPVSALPSQRQKQLLGYQRS